MTTDEILREIKKHHTNKGRRITRHDLIRSKQGELEIVRLRGDDDYVQFTRGNVANFMDRAMKWLKEGRTA